MKQYKIESNIHGRYNVYVKMLFFWWLISFDTEFKDKKRIINCAFLRAFDERGYSCAIHSMKSEERCICAIQTAMWRHAFKIKDKSRWKQYKKAFKKTVRRIPPWRNK